MLAETIKVSLVLSFCQYLLLPRFDSDNYGSKNPRSCLWGTINYPCLAFGWV